MKHIIRRPVLPLLLGGLLIFGIVFLTLFQKNMEDGEKEVETIYNNTTVFFRVLPGENATNDMQISRIKADRILDLEGVADTYTLMRTGYALRSPTLEEKYEGVIYGTKNLKLLAMENEIEITFFAGESQETFTDFSYDSIPCLLPASVAEIFGLNPGDALQIAPAGWGVTDDAPVFDLYLAGTFEDPMRNLFGLVVPEELFLEDVTKPHLLYTSHMMYDCVYRQLSFEIDPKHNRNHLEIVKQVEDILPTGGRFEVLSNAKTLTNAVRPLERKLAIQKLLLPPLAGLLCASVAVVAVLLSLSWRREIFLRLMWGEKRPTVLLKMLLGMILLLAVASGLSLGGVALLGGVGKISAALVILGLMDGLCLAVSFGTLCLFCFRNLVSLYQTGEGE